MAGRKTTGRATGDIRFAGNTPTRPFLRRYTGYVSLALRPRFLRWRCQHRRNRVATVHFIIPVSHLTVPPPPLPRPATGGAV